MVDTYSSFASQLLRETVERSLLYAMGDVLDRLSFNVNSKSSNDKLFLMTAIDELKVAS